MKIRVVSQLPKVKIGSSAILGKELATLPDNVGHAAYEINVQAGDSLCLVSPFGEDFNHIYYCFHGQGAAELGESDVTFAKDTMVALTGKMQMKVTASGAAEMRIYAAFVKACEDPDVASPTAPVVKRLADIIGGERDVDWTRGRSRRFLAKADGFNISVHNTICYPGHSSSLKYDNNYETNLCVRGDITYTWDGDTKSHQFQQASPADGDGCVFLLDDHDAHTLHAKSTEGEILCLFYPPLKGTETHDFNKEGFSSYRI